MDRLPTTQHPSQDSCGERRLVVVVGPPAAGRANRHSSAHGREHSPQGGRTATHPPTAKPPTTGRANRHLSARSREIAGQPKRGHVLSCGAIMFEHCPGQPGPGRQASGRRHRRQPPTAHGTERQAPAAEPVQEQPGQNHAMIMIQTWVFCDICCVWQAEHSHKSEDCHADQA